MDTHGNLFRQICRYSSPLHRIAGCCSNTVFCCCNSADCPNMFLLLSGPHLKFKVEEIQSIGINDDYVEKERVQRVNYCHQYVWFPEFAFKPTTGNVKR